MAFNIISIIRLAAFSAITLFSVIVLGAAAHIISVTESTIRIYWAFVAFAIAVSLLTILTLPPLIVISVIRSGAPPNYVIIELAWTCVLWVLWMASASYSANQLSILPSGCNYNISQSNLIKSYLFFCSDVLRAFYSSLANLKTINCGEFWAVEAFAWLNWLILMPYIGFILVLSIIQHSRGNHHVWTHTVHQVNFFAVPEGVNPGMVPQQQVYSPQPMVQQPLQQQMPVQYAAGTPPATYATPPPQQQTPMNTGYAQPPANTGYAQAPTNTGYPPAPANTGYLPDPANPGYPQGTTNPVYPQV